MAILTRESILEAQDLGRKTVNVPRWGGEITLQEMTAARQLEFEKLLTEDEDRLRILIVAFSAVDENGKLLFTVEDVERLAGKNFRVIRQVSDVAMNLNRFGPTEEAALEENFPGSQG